MNELFDKLILRIALALFICILLIGYKYIHTLLYPNTRNQFLKIFHPSKNPAETLHLFGRILGIGIVFSQLHFYLSGGILIGILDFLLHSFLSFALYLGSLYFTDSVILGQFDYTDEVIKRKNMPYATVSFSNAIAIAFLNKTIFSVGHSSLIFIIFLWLFSMVLVGFAAKTYSFLAEIPFYKYIVQKNMSVAISFSGFFWGFIIIISTSINTPITHLKWYTIKVILSLLLSLIILPIVKKGLIFVFKIQKDYEKENLELVPTLGDGLYDGVLFLTSSLLAGIVTGQINFGTFYPIF